MDLLNYILTVETKSKEHYDFVRNHFDFPIEINYENLINNNNRFIIGVRLVNSNINKLIGVSIFTIKSDTINIDYVAIHKEFRRKGINQKINQLIEDIAISNYIDTLTASIRENNCSSISSFTRFGFILNEKRKYKYKNGDVKLRFFKNLK
jgi:ribosomal protein S18 acetylase RimI-like enzyme